MPLAHSLTEVFLGIRDFPANRNSMRLCLLEHRRSAFVSSFGHLCASCTGNQHDARRPAGAGTRQPPHEQWRASAAWESWNGRPHLKHLAGLATGAYDARECCPSIATLMSL